MLLYIIIAIGVATVLAVVVTALLQRRMFRKNLRLEIGNEGNVPSQYLLRGETPDGRLAIQFSLEGERLAPGEPLELDVEAQPAASRAGRAVGVTGEAQPAASRPSAGQRAGRAVGVTGLVADLLSSLGFLLPHAVGGPLISAAGRLRGVQMTAARAQQVPGKVGHIVNDGRSVGRQAGGSQAAGRPAAGRARPPARGRPDPLAWLQTPPVFPGETLVVDMQLRAIGSGGAARTFQIVSRPAAGTPGEWGADAQVVAQGTTDMSAGFWARLLPFLIILAAAALGLLLVGGLASLGVLLR